MKTKPVVPIVILISFILLGISIPQMELDIGFYGLIHSFPPTYFIGLILLITSFITALALNSSHKILGIQTLGLLVFLWLAPTIAGTHPGLALSYRSLQDIGTIAANEGGYWWYLSWPGFQTLFSVMSNLGIDLERIITVYPFLIELAYAAPLYIFLRNTLGKAKEKYCWIGLWIFYLGNWTGQDYFGPQSLAVLLLLTILAIITHKNLWEGSIKSKLAMTFILVVVYAGLVVTHLLTSIAALCIIATYAIIRKSPRLLMTLIVCILLIFSWDVTYGGHYTFAWAGEPYGHRLLEENTSTVITIPSTSVTILEPEYRTGGYTDNTGILTFNPEYIIYSNIGASLYGSDSHIAVVKTRIIYSVGLAIIGIIGALYILTRKRSRTNIAILAMASSLLLLLPLRYAGWELTSRLYMFELPFLAYLGATLFALVKRKSIIIIVTGLFIVSSMLFLVSHYGNQEVDYLSKNYIDGNNFVNELKQPGTVFGYLHYIYWEEDTILFKNLFPKEPHYLAISTHDDKIYTFLYNDSEFVDNTWNWLKNNMFYTSIYKNPEFEVFKYE